MHSSGDFLSTPSLDYEAWPDVVRSICGRYTPHGIGAKTFSGRVRVRSICGSPSFYWSRPANGAEGLPGAGCRTFRYGTRCATARGFQVARAKPRRIFGHPSLPRASGHLETKRPGEALEDYVKRQKKRPKQKP
jgi:hypothetical protein